MKEKAERNLPEQRTRRRTGRRASVWAASRASLCRIQTLTAHTSHM